MQPTDPESIDFDENWYLARNQDVAMDVRRGRLKSGLAHYLMHGRDEGRLPLPPPGQSRSVPRAAENVSSIAADVQKSQANLSLQDVYLKHNGTNYLTPSELSISATTIRRVALIGSCLLESWRFHKVNPSNCVADLVVMNNAGTLPEPDSGEPYDFQVVQVPLRAVLRDDALWHLPSSACEAHALAFEQACDHLAFQLKARMQWNIQNGLLSFVVNFFVPQRNLMGCLFPRYDLRNPEFFIDKLNERLENLVRGYKNAYVLDVDRISASLGRRFIQDDLIAMVSHNALIPMPGEISTRIEPLAPMSAHFEVTWPLTFRDALWAELVGMFRTLRQIDAVKLVVVDLDDTLWNGVSGEMAEVDPFMLEGWPIGLTEALCYLKKRGILLAIISKNEEQRIRDIWTKIFRDRLKLDDFAAIRINWRPKAENLSEILSAMNLLPRSVVFIDDNPVERAAISHAFPEVRVMGRYPYYLRQTLLWASETQVVSITEESSRRTEMIKAQLERETRRTEMTTEDFLRAASPKAEIIRIATVEHARFSRALELINKTNQFNTTGRRWTLEQCDAFLKTGGSFLAFEVTDSYTGYGLVGVVVLRGPTIEQWVMSCRVLGYRIEEAIMATVVHSMRSGGIAEVYGHLIKTDVNFPCRDLFTKCGFVNAGAQWVLGVDTDIASPAHVTVVGEEQTVKPEFSLSLTPELAVERSSVSSG
jgi:FkbH-like protein